MPHLFLLFCFYLLYQFEHWRVNTGGIACLPQENDPKRKPSETGQMPIKEFALNNIDLHTSVLTNARLSLGRCYHLFTDIISHPTGW